MRRRQPLCHTPCGGRLLEQHNGLPVMDKKLVSNIIGLFQLQKRVQPKREGQRGRREGSGSERECTQGREQAIK